MENGKQRGSFSVNRLKMLCALLLFLLPVTEIMADTSAYAQSVRFAFSVSNVPVKEILNKIESESEFVFVYYEGTFDPLRKVSINASGKGIRQILDELFAGKGVVYEINDRQVMLKKADPAAKTSTQQGVTVKGIVRDQNGETIIGANITIKGSATGVITNIMGEYQISAKRGDVLVVSFIGYKTQEIKVGKENTINVTLTEDAKVLSEVVVTAFGVGQKKESVVGAISQVRGKDLQVPSSNLSNSFAGRMAGVTAYQRTGEPGNDGSSFYIRGISTFTAQSPLIIIDGVEASSADLNALDSEVIESFSVLKDATATAMYGTRGANGVMIVTTKGGEVASKAIITTRIEGYVATPTSIPEFADPVTYMNMYNEAANNYGSGGKYYSRDFINGVAEGTDSYRYPNVDWYDELFKKASFNQRVNLNVRGGSKRVDYFVNANFVHESGMMKGRSKEFYSYDNNIDVKRYTFQSNINAHLTSTATLSMNLGVEMRDNTGPAANTGTLFTNAMNSNPVDFPVMFPTGSNVGSWGTSSDYIKWGGLSGSMASSSTNPLAELTKGYKDYFESTVRANVKYNQKLDFITKGLQFNALLSFKNWFYTSNSRTRGYNRYEFKDINDEGLYLLNCLSGTEAVYTLGTNRTNGGNRRFYFQTSLNYDRTFNKRHNVSAMFLYNQDQSDTGGVTTDLIETLPKRRMGIAARLSYDYDRQYMAEVNMGYNGSESFAEGNRWGFFPSLALGWNISQEPWFEKARNVVHNLKLRGSYGLVGNADGGTRFMYLSLIDLGKLSFVTGDGEQSTSLAGPSFSRFENSKISWEVGYKANVGIDLGLFNSLNLSIEYFNELRKDIFRKNNMVPNYFGTADAVVYGNYAEIKNWGVELSADYGKQITKDFSVQFKGTFSFARNKILKDVQPWNPNYPHKSNIGRSLNSLEGYRYAGHLFIDDVEIANSPTQSISGNVSPGDIKYVDIADVNGNYDGIINSNDIVQMGYPTVPEIIYGFGPSFKYKNLDFSFFFQGAANTSFFISGFHPFGSDMNRNVLKFIADDYWSVDNQNIYAKYPRLTQLNHANNTANSDYWLRNGSFLKLKNAEIGYSWKFLRAYISGSNLLTFSPFKLWDPEMGGGSGLKYPTQRMFNFGVQFNFK